MKGQTIVFKLSDNLKDEVLDFYKEYMDDKKPDYSLFQARQIDCTITFYTSGKIMFQGIGADIEASYWIEQERIKNNRNIYEELKSKDKKKEKEKKDKIEFNFNNISTIGSDEVGTGDYFGPIVVTASYVSIEHISLLLDLGVKDSKKITDEKIMSIAPTLIKEIPHKTYILTPQEYNDLHETNMNKIKAILHNRALYNLIKDNNYNYERIVVDEFVYKEKYYEHIKDMSFRVNNITFITKAEDKCLSVAVSSIISRYLFIKSMDKLSDELGIVLPKGAGEIVDKTGADIVKKYGIKKLEELAKLNFKNTKKIENLID